MRRSTTSVGTDRRIVAFALIAELVLGAALVGRPVDAPPGRRATADVVTTAAAPIAATLRDGRTVRLIGLGGQRTGVLLTRIASEVGAAADAITAFWGTDWPGEIVIVAAGSDGHFHALADGLGADTAAAAVADRADPERGVASGQRIVFAPGAAEMGDGALRIVLRHELFHYAARAGTALDAPRWLTEGVADFVARPAAARPGPSQAALGQLPTDADLDSVGAARSLAYDRAWWFSRFVADRYGMGKLRALYLRACGVDHPDAPTAVRETLGMGLPDVLTEWRQWLTG